MHVYVMHPKANTQTIILQPLNPNRLQWLFILLQYFMIVFLIFVTMLVGGILGYVFREKVHTTMEQEMQSTVRSYTTNRAVKRAWDDTQERVGDVYIE